MTQRLFDPASILFLRYEDVVAAEPPALLAALARHTGLHFDTLVPDGTCSATERPRHTACTPEHGCEGADVQRMAAMLADGERRHAPIFRRWFEQMDFAGMVGEELAASVLTPNLTVRGFTT